MSDYSNSEDVNESIETFPWMETEHRDEEGMTCFYPPQLEGNSQVSTPGRSSIKSRGMTSTFLSSEIPDDAKKCMFYYLPGVLFGKKLNPL
ncbi:hypothetical protein M9Y10_013313 [Tritrichomonas musculus]|uniref:Uncharacterized protein n=1 Tax=Tritrichomonas musculus TaxID=1915356 RepID=A0ABR2I8A5_9EUKA